MVASRHYQLDLTPHGMFPSKPWGLLSTGGFWGAEDSGGTLSLAPWALAGLTFGVRVPSSGTGILRASPEREGSLMKHQPALWCQRFPLLYVHYYYLLWFL